MGASDLQAPISGIAGEGLRRDGLGGLSPHRLAALEQPTGRQRVATLDRADPRGAQQLRGPSSQVSRPIVVSAEAPPIVGGVLEVVADDLLVFRSSIARCLLLEVGEALVELRPLLLRQRRIGSIADENVPEAIRIQCQVKIDPAG